MRLLLPPRLPIANLKLMLQEHVRWLHQCLSRARFLGVLLFASFFLSGCIQYDLGIQFDNPNQGHIVQYIQIAEQLQNFGVTATQQWLDTIEQRSRKLGGRVDRRPNQELVVTIPFGNNTELERKFNQFFSPLDKGNPSTLESGTKVPEIKSNLELSRSNFLLVERNRLRYDLDLRSLGVLSSNGNLLISPGSLFDLKFRLNTPWRARNVTPNSATSNIRQNGNELVWQMVPGEFNHLEAVFWLPSPLGIGTLIIGLLVVAGIFLRYPQTFRDIAPFTAQSTDSNPDTAT